MIQKIMAMPRPSEGLLRLYRSGVLQSILPEVCALDDVAHNGTATHKNNFTHTLRVLDRVAAVTGEADVRWAALLHDVGKSVTRKWDAAHGWTFKEHEARGAAMAEKILRRLRLPGVCPERVCRLVRLHMTPGTLDGVTDAALNRFRAAAGDALPGLLVLAKSDVTTANREVAAEAAARYARLEERIAALDRAECRPPFDTATCNIVMNCTAAAVPAGASLAELRNRYGRFVVSSRKHRGAGRCVRFNYKWVWDDYATFISELRAVLPSEYAFIRMDCMRHMFLTAGGDVRAYREAVKAVRREYGLSKSAVERYMSV